MNDVAQLAPLDESLAALFAEEAVQNVVSDHARVAVLRGLEHALLLAPAVAASTVATATGAVAGASAAGDAARASTAGFTAKAVVGIAAVAFCAGGLTAHAVEQARAPVDTEQVQSAPVVARAAAPLAEDASIRFDAAPSVTIKPAAASTTAAIAAPSATLSSLAAERELLDVGRAALARGRGEDALAAAKNHAKQFPSGQLSEEREVLAIQALRVSGKKPEAAARAALFAKRYPQSIYAGALEEP